MEPLIINLKSGCSIHLEGDKYIKIIIDGKSNGYFFEEVIVFEEQSQVRIKDTENVFNLFKHNPRTVINVKSSGDYPTTITLKRGDIKNNYKLIFTNKIIENLNFH